MLIISTYFVIAKRHHLGFFERSMWLKTSQTIDSLIDILENSKA